MDQPQFDRLTRAFAASRTRRALSQGLAALSVIGACGLLADKTAARRAVRAEKKTKKKTLCLNGETIKAKKKKVKKLRKRGATSGACRTCQPTCPQAQRCCGATCVTSPWTNQTTFGMNGTGVSNFQFPNGLALTPDGLTVLITDGSNSRVSVWTRPNANSPTWSNQTTFGSGGSTVNNFSSPRGVALTPDGLTAAIADTLNHRVSVWTRPNATSPTWGNPTTFGTLSTGPTGFQFPRGVALTPDGLTALVADSSNNRISVWTRADTSSAWGNQTTFGSSGGNLSSPQGVALSPDSLTALVADANNHRISVWTRPSLTSAWSNQTTFGSLGSAAPNFNFPTGVALTPDSLSAVITDSENDRISVWTRPSPTSTAWANQTTFGADGAGVNNFKAPQGVALTPDGLTALVADTSNNRISAWVLTCPA